MALPVALIPWLANAIRLTTASWKTWIIAFLGLYIVPWIINIFKAAGVGFVYYQLGSYALDNLFGYLKSTLDMLPPEVIIFLSLAKVDEAISIIFAAFAAKLTLKGFTNTSSTGKKKDMVWEA